MISKLLLLLTLLFVVISILLTQDDYKEYRNIILSWLPFLTYSPQQAGRMFTKAELSKFTGEDNSPVYLSILGEVYDVTAGRKHYGKGGSYGFFAGQDGTRAFVTGQFNEDGLIESTDGLSDSDILGIEDWKGFYKKQYKHIGRLIGHFYKENGDEAEGIKHYHKQLDTARRAKLSDEDDKNRFPPCNFAYKQDEGRRIWCSDLSGGVKRDWVGVPRQYFQPGKTDPRCACVKDLGPPSGSPAGTQHNNRGDLDNPLMKLYEGCDPRSVECRFKE